MAVKFSIYCRQQAGDLTPEQLVGGIAATDLRSAAENQGVSPEVAESAISELVAENTGWNGFSRFRICYLPSQSMPIDVDHLPGSSAPARLTRMS